jgi:hypothetical protein
VRRVVIIGLAAFLLIVIAAVLVSPAVEPHPATSRSSPSVFALLFVLVLCRKFAGLMRAAQVVSQSHRIISELVPPNAPRLIELNCTRLC